MGKEVQMIRFATWNIGIMTGKSMEVVASEKD